MCILTRAERFKDARTVYNKNGKQSMEEVYKATGVSASLIKDLEDDDKSRSVGYDKIAILANHYGVSADYLLSITNDPEKSPCATDDLGLSANAVRWMLELANSIDGDRYTKHLSTLLEMQDFQTLLFSLIEYFSAIKAASVAESILNNFASPNDLYPTAKTLGEKLAAAQSDPQYDDEVQQFLQAIESFNNAYIDAGMCFVLDDERDGISVLDILELKIKRNLDSVIRGIENEKKEKGRASIPEDFDCYIEEYTDDALRSRDEIDQQSRYKKTSEYVASELEKTEVINGNH